MPVENTPAPGPVARPPLEIIPDTALHLSHVRLIIGGVAATFLLGAALVAWGASAVGRSAVPAVDDSAVVAQQAAVSAQIATQPAAAPSAVTTQSAALEASATTATLPGRDDTVAEGRLVAADVSGLKAMRMELGSAMGDLNRKAAQSAAALKQWNAEWAARQADYERRLAAASAHNTAERQRYFAGKVERASSSGKLVIVDTYKPSYVALPSRPAKPAPVTVSITAEVKRIATLQGRILVAASTIASHTASGRSFSAVYPALTSAAQTLKTSIGQANSCARVAVVSKGAKGSVVDAAKLSAFKPAVLDSPFARLDRTFTGAITAAGLTPAQLIAGGSAIQ